MNCEIFCSKAREYLDDLLPPEIRREISRHYVECARCRSYALGLGTFASDFRKMLHVALPVTMEEKILAEATGRKPVLERARPSSAASWAILASGILLVGICFVAGDYLFKIKPKAKALSPQSSGGIPKGPLALQGLPAPNKPPVSTAAGVPVLKSSKHAISLRPLHWDLNFASVEERTLFLETVKAEAVATAYDSESFLDLSFSRAEAEKILPRLLKASRDPLAIPLKSGMLPDFSGEIAMSFFLYAPQTRAGGFVLKHWHFRFQFPNRYPFLEDLKKKDIHFLYESPEIWIFEAPESEMNSVYSLVHNTHALIADFGAPEDRSLEGPGVLARVSVYIEEG